jgi:phospholipase C
MVGGAALGAFGALSGRRGAGLSSAQARLLDQVTGTAAASTASLSDIKHVVILLQENRDREWPGDHGLLHRSDLAFYYALADAFTICDNYHCPVLGPTDPNRLMGMTATIDPAGASGGPVVETFSDRVAEYGKLSWETMPERLLAAGVSWKVYNDPTGLIGLSPLPYFKAYNNPFSVTGFELVSKGLTPTYPASFAADVKSGKLPSFSRGGYVASQTFDHTSTLRLIETLFGVEVPNLSAWRRGVTGNLTSALALANPPNTSVPSLPATSLGETSVAEQAVLNALAGTLDVGIPYPLPTTNSMPSQETTPNRPPVPGDAAPS